MNFEDLQKSWQNQGGTPITVNSDLLLKEIRRNQEQFRTTIRGRDLREVTVFLLLVPSFAFGGWLMHWSLYLCAFACAVEAAFFVLDRRLQKKKTPDLHESLKDCAATSLAEVTHQIWLLRNVHWWYLLPLFLPMVLFFAWCAWSAPGVLIIFYLLSLVGVALLYVWIYWINQAAVKKSLQPRRQELENLMTTLETEYRPAIVDSRKPLAPALVVLAACVIAVVLLPFKNPKPSRFETILRKITKSISGVSEPGAKPEPRSGRSIDSIEAIRNQYNVPALGVVVTKDGKICDRAVAGVRKQGDATPATTNDLFHIGSCTKSMTATLAAMFIEQGKLRWDTTLAEAFPELKGKMDKRYEAVTVEQLLQHRGGMPTTPPPAAWARAWEEVGTPVQQRLEFLEAVLRAPPEAESGTKKIYSNSGYVAVGVMLEKISGQDFESLMKEKLFKPLGMSTAGFGPPGTKDKVDQPWGHTKRFGTTPVQGDNPPVYSAAGRVHCSLDDLARYAMLHLQRTNALLKPETMARLHASPVGAKIENVMDDYACGWVRMKRPWSDGTVLWHNGSNTMWFIVMWLAPDKNFSVIAATNITGNAAEEACDAAAVAMIDKWLSK